MKSLFRTSLLSAVLFFSVNSFANHPEPTSKIKDVSKCRTCKGSKFIIKSRNLSVIKIYDEYGNLIDTSSIESKGELHYTFSTPGVYFLELINEKGKLERKKLIVD